MATVLDQHYFKIVPEPVITNVVGGAGNTITITGTGLKLLTSKHRLLVGLNVVPDIVVNTTAVGDIGVDEEQQIFVDATGGTFTVTFGADTTPALDYDITAVDLEAALEALPSIGVGNVNVTGGPGDDGGTTPYIVTFVSSLGWQNVPDLTTDATLLTGGASTATVLLGIDGQGGVKEVQTIDISHAIGGTFTVTYDGEETSNLPLAVTAAALETALEALPNIAPGDVNVTGGSGSFSLEFDGNLAWTNVVEVTVDGTNLTVAPSLEIALGDAELTTNNLTSLVIDLSDYEGEDVTDVTLLLPNVFSIDHDVNPDITLAA